MITENSSPTRFIGIDLHKHYLVAFGVDADLNQVLGPRRVRLGDLEAWMRKTLGPQDAVVLEMTTNTWEAYDALLPHVHSVTVVHPPHVKLITQPRVMTDRIAALNLAKLHAKGLLVGIWVPPQEVRHQRALIAQRDKMVKLSTQARNRLHAVLHRHHLPLPEKGSPFAPERRTWWVELPLSSEEKVCVICDLDTLDFARNQIALLEQVMNEVAARDERVPLLVQLTGVGVISALTILAAVGQIERFPSAKHLVGYAGLGAGVHDSGQTTRTGKITKAGRRDLRRAMVESAWTAVRCDPHWKAEFERLEPRLGRNKAIVAIARKLLVAVWHVLSKGEANRFADPEGVARKLLQHTYRLGKANRPAGQTPGQYVRQQLDRLGLGQQLSHIPWGTAHPPVPLPPSGLPRPGG
jgi:transposase